MTGLTYVVTRSNPNGVPVAAPASSEHSTRIGAAIAIFRWVASGYAVDVRSTGTDMLSRIRRQPAVRVPFQPDRL